ncbi:Tigger transposable element-derived protein 6 [Dictyocoela muelleri]|nr:Tigger transposable element-derived protein 6 [Dictyocoela muelleri]
MINNPIRMSIQEKKKIAEEINGKGYTRKEIMIKYNISKSVATSIIKHVSHLINLQKNDSALEKRINLSNVQSKYAEIDSFLVKKLKFLRSKNIPVRQNTILKLAMDFYKEKNDCDTTVTNYFVKKFVERNSIKYITLHGEASSADLSMIDAFKENLIIKTKEYAIKDIFNVDETGLYIKAGYNKTYVLDKKLDCKNIKTEKTRMTVMLGLNMYGEKLKLLLIGKSNKPRGFRNIDMNTFNTVYRSNKTSWLTAEIFNDYLISLNDKLKIENRKILLLLDNFSGHKVGNKSNIELLFFPPNCTSIIQPLDLGIIHSFKSRFKSLLNNFQIYNALSNDNDQKAINKKIDFACVIRWVDKSFLEITNDVIKNCWNKTNLIPNNEPIIPLESPEITEESSSSTKIEFIEDIMETEAFQITPFKCNEVLNSLKTASKILQSYQSKHINECIDLQDKIISEYLELFFKDKLDFYIHKANKK